MNIHCIIPAKGNSTRIKNKNLIKINNISLIEHSIDHALESSLTNIIFTSSDSDKILNIAKNRGSFPIKRPKKLSKKYSTSEDVIFHYLAKIKRSKLQIPQIIVFLQPTSPFREKGCIDKAIKKLIKTESDSLFSSTVYKNHIWNKIGNKLWPINHSNDFSIMSQDKHQQIFDNGSFYIFKTDGFIKNKTRLFGRITDYPMEQKYSVQIDEVEDLKIIKELMKK